MLSAVEIPVLWIDKYFVYSLCKNIQIPQPLWHEYDWVSVCALST